MTFCRLLQWCALIGTVRTKADQATAETRDVKETQCCLPQKNEDHFTVSWGGDYQWWVGGAKVGVGTMSWPQEGKRKKKKTLLDRMMKIGIYTEKLWVNIQWNYFPYIPFFFRTKMLGTQRVRKRKLSWLKLTRCYPSTVQCKSIALCWELGLPDVCSDTTADKMDAPSLYQLSLGIEQFR